MPYFDTHIHIQDFKQSAAETIKLLQQQGINRCVCVSAMEADWEKVAALYEQFPQTVVPAFGIHPWYAEKISFGWRHRLQKLLQRFPTALIGECGLDRLKNPNLKNQEKVFKIQIDLAETFQRPLLIHAVKSFEWLQKFWGVLPEGYVFHSFNGPPQLLKKVIDSGGYAAFNFKIFQTKSAEQILKMIPPQRILFESDAPFQSQPHDIAAMCRRIAAIRAENEDELEKIVYQNSLKMINPKITLLPNSTPMKVSPINQTSSKLKNRNIFYNWHTLFRQFFRKRTDD